MDKLLELLGEMESNSILINKEKISRARVSLIGKDNDTRHKALSEVCRLYRNGTLQKAKELLILNKKEQGHITDEELDVYGKFTDREKQIIKEQYSQHDKGFFTNPRCALY